MSAERLAAVAQRLDELTEEMPELQALAEELTALVDSWPAPKPHSKPDPFEQEFFRMLDSLIIRRLDRDPQWAQGLAWRQKSFPAHTHMTYLPPDFAQDVFKVVNPA